MAASLSTSKPTPNVYLQVVGTETGDTSPSLYLFADSQRYLFNCGEATQRLCVEHKLRLSKVNNVFFTRICWEYTGGLPGLALTFRDFGKSDIRLHGPSTLSHFIYATRFFLQRENLKFDCVGFTGTDEDKYEDENITIWPLLLNDGAVKSRDDSSTLSDADDLRSVKRAKMDSPETFTAVCYICQLSSLPGKFFPKKAIELGVPKGPLFKDLVSGNVVTLEDGQQVHPQQVMGPAQPGSVFLIIECPTVAFIQFLVSNEQLKKYWEQGPCLTPVIIVHLTPMAIFQSKEYEHWRKGFGDKVCHLLINKDVCAAPLVFQAQATVQCKLNTIDPEIFPLLETMDTPAINQDDLPKNCFAGENLLKFYLREGKHQGFDRSEVLRKLDVDSIIKETQTLLNEQSKEVSSERGFGQRSTEQKELSSAAGTSRLSPTTSASVVNDLIRSPPTNRNTKINFGNALIDSLEAVGVHLLGTERRGSSLSEIIQMKVKERAWEREHKEYEVVFLGTGSAIPSKYRNVSSTLINMSEKDSILLDCGEGTYGQLYRHYGKYLDRVLRRLKCVFISHIHADHHLGLIHILKKRETIDMESDVADDLVIIGPAKIRKWLEEYNRFCEDIEYRFVDSRDLVIKGRYEDYQFVTDRLDAREVLTVPVDHCPQAFGLVITHNHGWKIVYSGDTRPCPALIEAGKGADLLIHEATLEDELMSEALEKKHSTTTEAITSGVEMGAKLIILNHFSQRYPKIPVFSEQFTKCTGIAFDHMKVHSSNFSKLPQLVEPLKAVFAKEMDEMTKN